MISVRIMASAPRLLAYTTRPWSRTVTASSSRTWSFFRSRSVSLRSFMHLTYSKSHGGQYQKNPAETVLRLTERLETRVACQALSPARRDSHRGTTCAGAVLVREV